MFELRDVKHVLGAERIEYTMLSGTILLSVIVFNVLTFGLGDHIRVHLTATL